MSTELTAWAAQLPVIVAVVVLALLLIWAGPVIRGMFVPPRDPARRFSDAQRHAMFVRAGMRCEHKPLLGPRCSARPTQGDHVYPWSKGGATAMSNAQGLCARHNRRKSDRVPGALYMYRLQRRRRRYFPAGEPTDVVWRQGLAR
ncbi:HNH endonuclease [Isoptericola croceus]|uniref:HNH endonuclease n=1 Tax=Isoptericola croceus TaxID=3031406 RepID=UPI0023FA2804|nr:HNH endonuclease [Isoptericola croceus]